MSSLITTNGGIKPKQWGRVTALLAKDAAKVGRMGSGAEAILCSGNPHIFTHFHTFHTLHTPSITKARQLLSSGMMHHQRDLRLTGLSSLTPGANKVS